MLNPGQRHTRLAAGVFADRSGDIHVDCALAFAYLRYASPEEVESWWRALDGEVAYRVVPVDMSDATLARLQLDSQWEEAVNG